MKKLIALIAIIVSVCVNCNGQNDTIEKALIQYNKEESSRIREAQELSGAGATFPLPFYNVFFENFAQVHGDIIAYGGVGSGGGVRNLRDKAQTGTYPTPLIVIVSEVCKKVIIHDFDSH